MYLKVWDICRTAHKKLPSNHVLFVWMYSVLKDNTLGLASGCILREADFADETTEACIQFYSAKSTVDNLY